jgi:1-pyrroline-5-carboxylate dehydrogenase
VILVSAGAKLLFGGKALTNHSIPAVYGAIEPTAVFIPIKEMLSPEIFPLATTEVFGPFQVWSWWLAIFMNRLKMIVVTQVNFSITTGILAR